MSRRPRLVNVDKPALGALSPGCASCVAGEWLCFYLTPACNVDCFYCANELEGAGCDYPKSAEGLTLDAERFVEYVRTFEHRGISFSGGEPLLEFERLLRYLRLVRDETGDRTHVWLYTNGTLLTEDKLRALRAVGLDEIRFDIAAADYRLDAVALARPYVGAVTIEIPAIPADVGRVKGLLPEMESLGVRHLNLHQLVTNRRNRRRVTSRGYASVPTAESGDVCIVDGSEEAAHELIALGARVLRRMGVQYCSYEYKTRYQRMGHRRRWSGICREEGDHVTRTGLMRRVLVDGAAGSAWEALERAALPHTAVAYYRPELEKVDRKDATYATCPVKGRDFGYRPRRDLVQEFTFASAIEVIIFHNLFELGADPEVLVAELAGSVDASAPREREIARLVGRLRNHFAELE